ncbi:MAG: PLD nuclease N-terminal domain-containing protein [Treponema sp.]|jgi:uncharacterized membrane protein YwaF|nr:PLD nuclease N-terminal domain-containing protein [Treponema sp.]
MEKLLEYLPFLIPLFVVQLGLMIASLVHIFRHNKYKMGNRPLWVAVCLLVNIIGPVLYFVIGRSDE